MHLIASNKVIVNKIIPKSLSESIKKDVRCRLSEILSKLKLVRERFLVSCPLKTQRQREFHRVKESLIHKERHSTSKTILQKDLIILQYSFSTVKLLSISPLYNG